MAVSAQRDSTCPVQILDDSAEHGPIFLRHGIPDRIGQIDGRGARIDGAPHCLAQEIDVGAAGVLSGKLNFRAPLASVAHVGRDGFQRLLARKPQLVM